MSTPEIDPKIGRMIDVVITNILSYCDDLDVEGVNARVVGYLPSKRGAKIVFENVYDISTRDIDHWQTICKESGANMYEVRVDTQSGRVYLILDYIKQPCTKVILKWSVRGVLIVIAYGIWTQLHLIEPDKYPMPW